LATIAQEFQNAMEAAPFCFAFFNCQTFKGAILLLGETVCSCAVKYRTEIYSGLWLRYAQKFLTRGDLRGLRLGGRLPPSFSPKFDFYARFA
jgi:hypothetical protein